MNEYLIKNIDNSFKKAREIEGKKYPYALLLNPIDAQKLGLDSFTYLPKSGFKSIPILAKQNIEPDNFQIAFSENELIELLKK